MCHISFKINHPKLKSLSNVISIYDRKGINCPESKAEKEEVEEEGL